MSFLKNISNRFQRYLSNYLNAPRKEYQVLIQNNRENLYRYIKKGDLVLVEGKSRVSKVIKLLTNSFWSHVAIYMGDELIQKDHPQRELYQNRFGSEADRLVIEALPATGVVVSPLSKYLSYNIRVCRPFGIKKGDLKLVMQDVISNLGKQYDQRNIVDLAWLFLPAWLNPFKKRSIRACLGRCEDFQVICSGMLAYAFQKVGYPILPELANPESHTAQSPYGAKLIMRNYTQIVPRDFDLSPNFQIVKFNIIEKGKFDYRHLPWENQPAEGPR